MDQTIILSQQEIYLLLFALETISPLGTIDDNNEREILNSLVQRLNDHKE